MLSRLIKEPHPLYNISFDSDSLFHGINLKTTQAPIRNRMAPSTEDSALSLITPSPNATTAFLAVQSSFLAVATLSVLARFYVRSTIIKNIGLDDIFIVIGLVLAFVVCALTSVTVSYGRQHSSQLHQGQDSAAWNTLAKALEFCTIATAVGIFSGLFTRLSICLFLLRIFQSVREWRLALYGVMAFTVAATVPPVVSFTAQCQPVHKQWDPQVPGNCWSPFIVVRIVYFGGAVSALCDVVLATLPAVFMWNMQMHARVKIGICVLMGMGYFTGMCAIARTIGFTNAAASASHVRTQVGSVIWAALEINVGIIAASIPTLKPLFKSSYPYLLRYFHHRKAAESPPRNNDEARLQKFTIGSMQIV